MWLSPVHVVLADRLAADVADELRTLPRRSPVVVHSQVCGVDRYHLFEAGSLVQRLDRRSDSQQQVAEVAPLRELPTRPAVALDDAGSAEARTVVLIGRDVAGVLLEIDDGTRGVAPPARRGETTADPASPDQHAPGRRGSRRFRAFPDLHAPPAVAASTTFTLRVAFRRDAATADDQPIIIPDAPASLEFVVQVTGFGFSFPDGIRRTLRVDRDDPTRESVEFPVVADPVRGTFRRSIEVSFSYHGNLCCQAWHDVLVSEHEPSSTQTGGERRTGGSGLQVADPASAPHLTVEIRSQQGGSKLQLLFSSPYDDVLPESTRHTVSVDLDATSSQAFAIQLLEQLPVTSEDAMWVMMRGLGRTVARTLPLPFWEVLEGVWRRVLAENGERGSTEAPTLLLVCSDPYVPWELAWVEDRYLSDDDLVPKGGAALGALWQVGRWIPPVATDRTGDRPPTPPEPAVPADHMAVVAPEFAGNALGDLPFARQEGESLMTAYDALLLGPDPSDVDKLFDVGLSRADAAFEPTVVHIAAHGESDPQKQQYTGVLLPGNRRIDPMWVQGTDLPGRTRPFVFLNACEVGTAGVVLSTYGGLAGAFLSEGCRGFLAPLWKVGDEAAHDVALDFYRHTIEDNLTAGEALRRIRAGFATSPARSSVPLAYIYYGHPSLRFTQD
jgi:hypothetical protein